MNTYKLFKKDFYERIGGLKQFRDLEVLDLGCGDGEDAYEISRFAKKVIGVDIVKNSQWAKKKKRNLKFTISKAEKLPFKANIFNGFFLKDVIHHVEDTEKTLREIKRVTTRDALIILIEGNRYNPVFYLHMTKMHGHEILSQENFRVLVKKYFPVAKFNHFESHYIPFLNEGVLRLIILLEKFIGKFSSIKPFLSYNVALIKKNDKT